MKAEDKGTAKEKVEAMQKKFDVSMQIITIVIISPVITITVEICLLMSRKYIMPPSNMPTYTEQSPYLSTRTL